MLILFSLAYKGNCVLMETVNYSYFLGQATEK